MREFVTRISHRNIFLNNDTKFSTYLRPRTRSPSNREDQVVETCICSLLLFILELCLISWAQFVEWSQLAPGLRPHKCSAGVFERPLSESKCEHSIVRRKAEFVNLQYEETHP